jgi:hypothetical protein
MAKANLELRFAPSNSTPHADARMSAVRCLGPSARAGERER